MRGKAVLTLPPRLHLASVTPFCRVGSTTWASAHPCAAAVATPRGGQVP